MVSREMVKEALRRYLNGTMTREEISDWAYVKLAEESGEFEDELVSEVLFNLVSFHNVGLIFSQYRPSQEKLKFLENWLEGQDNHDWDQYKQRFQPFKANLN